jgi:thiamine pyridinylase
MRRGAVAIFMLAVLALVAAAVVLRPAPAARRTLRVALYPFVPGKTGLFRMVEQSFRRSHPEVDLRIVDLSANYYDQGAPGAITNADADILEVDSVFIQDLIDAGAIQPIPASLRVSTGPLLRVAQDAVASGSDWYGVPHWLCTNFLFADADDPLGRAATFDDIVNAIGAAHPAGQGLLIDLKGRLTLGELYLDALLDKYKTLAAAAPFVPVAYRDQAVVGDLETARTLCDGDLCRDADYHASVSFYARLFARRQGRALVGYSERLYYVGEEVLNGCRKGECRALDRIAMVPLPLSSRGSQPFAWVDSLAIRRQCTGACLADAEAFIRETTSVDAVRAQLTPEPGDAPRYLMPALDALYTDPKLLAAAPLYRKFRPALQDAIAVRQAGLNASLREMGGYLDKNALAK